MAIRKTQRSAKKKSRKTRSTAKTTARSTTQRGKKTGQRKTARAAPARPKPKARPKVRSKARPKAKPRDASRLDLIEVRDSPIHGRGVYARTDLAKGKRILEYVGERISHREADRRYMEKGDDDGHTFFFVVDGRTVIDGGVGGNASRFVNHCCDPNCETVIEDRRVFVETVREVKEGEELGYDYQLTWETTDDPADLALYACRCGTSKCRGTMLNRDPVDKKKG